MRIKLSLPIRWWPLFRQTPDGCGSWGETTFVLDPMDECDAWVVYEDLGERESLRCPRQNVVLFTCEPTFLKAYPPEFLAQFGQVISCQSRLEHPGLRLAQPALPWWVVKTYAELNGPLPEKTLELSLICSDKELTPEHTRRLRFAQRLKEYFGERLDFFGRGARHVVDKWDALAPYRYSIALENCANPHYFTEKLSDCLLAGSFPFYFGCTNLDEYFEPGSYARINLDDFSGTVATIEAVLADPDHYTRSLPQLLEARRRCLDDYNLFPFVSRFLQPDALASETITLVPSGTWTN